MKPCVNVKKGTSCSTPRKKRTAYLATLIPGIILSAAYLYGLIATGVINASGGVPLGEGFRVIIYLYIFAPILTVAGIVLLVISWAIYTDKIPVK
jgi:hypothetical protein